MRIKIWTGLVTLMLSAVLLRYYIIQFQRTREAAGGESITESAKEDMLVDESDTAEDSTVNEPSAAAADVQMIRVLLKTDNFAGEFHENPEIRGTGDFWVEQKGKRVYYEAGGVFSPGQALQGAETWTVGLSDPAEKLEILNLKRNQNPPAYYGTLEVIPQEEGYVLINELPLEEYLPSVLSSEMSASFPMEALKAQAVSARTYAAKRMQEENVSCYGADLDDSVSYQVYNNVQSSKETRQAVAETKGQVLIKSGRPGNKDKSDKIEKTNKINKTDKTDKADKADRTDVITENISGSLADLADVFYYSTSCGVSCDDSFKSEEEFREFIVNGRETDMERKEVWYRWQTEVSLEEIRQNLLDMELEPPEESRE